MTFGAQTGRGSDRNCVIKRTTDYQFHVLITLMHQLAQSAVGPMLLYLGFQILKLGVGQNLNQHKSVNRSDKALTESPAIVFSRWLITSHESLRALSNSCISVKRMEVIPNLTDLTHGQVLKSVQLFLHFYC